MKKLSFFLMAMLISVMSFAETELFTQTYPGSPSSYTNAYTKSFTVTTGDYTLTYTNINNGQASDAWTAIRSGSKKGASVATIASEQIAAPIAKVVINFTQAKASSTNALYLEVSANSDFSSATKIAADIAVGNVEFPIAAPAANQYYKITIDQAKGSENGFNRFDKVVFYQGEAAGEDVEIVAAPEFSVTEANFTTAFTLDITSEEGTTLKYTIDNTDPSTSATAIEVATNSTSVQITKSTAVKAIAIKGELKSVTKSKVYCYVNSAETAYTVAEAMEVIDAGLGLANELYVKGEISTIEKYDAKYGSITYWIKDEEGNKFECYSGLGLNKAKFTSINDLVVGSKVVVCGVMKKYNTTYEFNYNNYIVSLELPVVKFNVTVTATAEGEDVVTGGGEYEEGEEVTVTASEDLEGWVFIGWTEDGEFVANDPEYTFVVKGDVELVAVYAMDLGENKVTDLVIDGDNMLLTGSVADFQMGTMNLELALGEYDEEEGTYLLTEESKLYVGETNFTFVDGMAAIDMNTNSAMAIVVFEYNGTYYYMTVNMSKKIEATIIEIADATVTIEERSMGFGDEVYHVLKMESTWSDGETTYPVLLETTEFDQTKESQEVAASITVGGMGDEDPWLGNAEGDVTIAVADGKVTVEGLLENAYAWPAPVAFDVTISGKLPVVEPTTITYELNGGVLPLVGPTNAELWEMFKPYYNTYYGLARADQPITLVTTFAATYMQKIMTDEASEYKWLGDYVQSVATAAGVPLSTDMASANEGGWRWAVHAFFNAAAGQHGAAGIDFTEAGKPENWVNVYPDAQEVVLPTEPVAEDYVLPTPTKEGYTFVGWYDNAEGEGDAYTVILAGWAGTLYAIWEVEGPATALENIAVEGKAVKAIINGQLIIIKNGVQYNAQGQVVK